MRTTIKAFVAACALLAAAGSAQAADSFRFDISKYDLSQSEGAAAFRADLDKASATWCRKQAPNTGTRNRNVGPCKALVSSTVLESMPAAAKSDLARAEQAGSRSVVAAR